MQSILHSIDIQIDEYWKDKVIMPEIFTVPINIDLFKLPKYAKHLLMDKADSYITNIIQGKIINLSYYRSIVWVYFHNAVWDIRVSIDINIADKVVINTVNQNNELESILLVDFINLLNMNGTLNTKSSREKDANLNYYSNLKKFKVVTHETEVTDIIHTVEFFIKMK